MKIKKTDLPDGWKSVKLKDVCLKTSNIKWNDNNGEEFNYIDLSAVCRDSLQVTETVNVNKNNAPSRAKKIIYTGDVIFATTRPTLKRVAIIPNELNNQICSTGFTVLRPNSDKILTEYLFYSLLLDSFMIRMEALQRGASYPAVTDTDVKGFQIPLPPLPEQQSIVSILDHCFEAIDKAKANAEQNLKNAKELFESYLQGVFEKKGKGWEEKQIKEICTLINGKAYKKDELLDKGKYRVLRVGNFFTNKHWYYSDLELDDDKYCDKGDLLYAWSASFGPRIWKEEKVIYHYHIWKVVPDLKLVTRDFLFTLFEWDKEKIKTEQGTGTTMIHVSKGSMENRIIQLPPIEKQESIVHQLNALRIETQQLETHYQKRIDDLEELKKSILQKAFAGELKTEKMVEEFEEIQL